MSDDIDALRARADELDAEDDAAVEVNEAILRLEEGDLIATRRLALALVKRGDLDRAEEVVQEALLLHPGDPTLTKRLDGIVRDRRWAANEAASPRGARGPSGKRVARTWLKAVSYDGSGWEVEPGEELWLSDPGQRDADGNRMLTAAGEPWGRPSWRVGEQVGVYLSGTQRVPVLVEITVAPAFDPEFVQAAGWAKEGDGERWPWVTHARVVKAVKLDAAPTLEELGITRIAMQRRARLTTTPEIHARLVEALDAPSA